MDMGTRTPLILCLLLAGGASTAGSHPRQELATPTPEVAVAPTKIRIVLEGRALTATLEQSEAARDFLELLPLTLTLTDYHSTEKVADLPRRLSTKGSPAGVDPDVGDITYYAPWGNLAIFYRDFGYASGLVRLGRLEAGAEALSGPGPLRVTIERAPR